MPQDQIVEIKDKIDIVDLISSYIPLKKAGRNFKALCPFHSEKTPSFMVSPELQIYKCFGCSKAGDVYSFLQEIEGYDFAESLQVLADRAGVKLKKVRIDEKQEKKDKLYQINQLASDFYHYILTSHKIGKKALKYLKDRGINETSIKDFNLGYSPKSWEALGRFLSSKKFLISDIVAAGLAIPKEKGRGYYDRFRGRIMFPLRNSTGKVLGFAGRICDPDAKEAKYINTPETLVFNKSAFLYGYDLTKKHIKASRNAILVEGQTDVISAYQAGYKNVVATGGTALTVTQVRMLKRLTDDVIISFDPDKAGIEASKRGIEIAAKGGLNVRVLIIPKEYKDLDDFIRAQPKRLEDLIKNAKSVYEFYFKKTLSEYNPSDPIGKKKIAKVLLPVIANIPDNVERAHYVRKLSVELNVPEESLFASMDALNTGVDIKEEAAVDSIKKFGLSLEEYILALILKFPLDLAKKATHKLGIRDFTNEDLANIFSQYKNFVSRRKKAFNITSFYDKLHDSLKARVQELYLIDTLVRHLADDLREDEIVAILEDEAENTIKLLKKETIKRELRELGRKIKEAESVDKVKELKKLKREFTELSKRLV